MEDSFIDKFHPRHKMYCCIGDSTGPEDAAEGSFAGTGGDPFESPGTFGTPGNTAGLSQSDVSDAQSAAMTQQVQNMIANAALPEAPINQGFDEDLGSELGSGSNLAMGGDVFVNPLTTTVNTDEFVDNLPTVPGFQAASNIPIFGDTLAQGVAEQYGQLLNAPGSTVDPETGFITAPAGQGTLQSGRFGQITYSGMPDPNYTGPFANLVNPPMQDNSDVANPMSAAPQTAPAMQDQGMTTPSTPQISSTLATDVLQDPFFLYSGQGNLYRPYGYSQNTLVDLLRSRNLTQPSQAAQNIGMFGNPLDFRT